MSDSTISFVYFEVFFRNRPTIKVSPAGGLLPPYGGSIAPMYTKITYYHTITIVNKRFKFQSNWLKKLSYRYNCAQFCPTLLC